MRTLRCGPAAPLPPTAAGALAGCAVRTHAADRYRQRPPWRSC